MPFKRQSKDKYASRSPERIWCLNSVRLVFGHFRRGFTFSRNTCFQSFLPRQLLKLVCARLSVCAFFACTKTHAHDDRSSYVWVFECVCVSACGFVCAFYVYACEKCLESISNSNPNPASWHDYAYLKKSFRRSQNLKPTPRCTVVWNKQE